MLSSAIYKVAKRLAPLLLLILETAFMIFSLGFSSVYNDGWEVFSGDS